MMLGKRVGKHTLGLADSHKSKNKHKDLGKIGSIKVNYILRQKKYDLGSQKFMSDGMHYCMWKFCSSQFFGWPDQYVEYAIWNTAKIIYSGSMST